MHELSLALEVCRMAEERLARNGGGRLVAVGVEVGTDAGIEVANFRFCLTSLLESPPFGGVRAEVVEQPGDDLELRYLEVDDGG